MTARLIRQLQASRDDLEMRIMERTAELQRRNQELQDFAFIASHDLHEPVRKIRTFGDMLQSKFGSLLEEEGRAP